MYRTLVHELSMEIETINDLIWGMSQTNSLIKRVLVNLQEGRLKVAQSEINHPENETKIDLIPMNKELKSLESYIQKLNGSTTAIEDFKPLLIAMKQHMVSFEARTSYFLQTISRYIPLDIINTTSMASVIEDLQNDIDILRDIDNVDVFKAHLKGRSRLNELRIVLGKTIMVDDNIFKGLIESHIQYLLENWRYISDPKVLLPSINYIEGAVNQFCEYIEREDNRNALETKRLYGKDIQRRINEIKEIVEGLV